MRALGELISLAAGLSGGWSTNEELDRRPGSVSMRFVPGGLEDTGTLSKDVCLTLALTIPRLLMGSSDITRGFGLGR